jgi:hypothetical protein
MGIKNLNRFFLDNCSEYSIRKMNLVELSNKIIVIDVSIYLYKYVENDCLVENMHLMVSKMISYNITPIFVFDGKPPAEKLELLEKRKQEKKVAEDKFNELKVQLENVVEDDQHKKEELKIEMDTLKKKFVRIKSTHIQLAKSILDAMGVFYIESKGEADHLCSYLAKHNYAWACMSDDMDMFLLDCPRVLRHLNLMDDSVMFYETANILRELCMSYEDFKNILIISGTDYNVGDEVPHLYLVIEQYCAYRNELRHAKKKCGGREGGCGTQKKNEPSMKKPSVSCDVRNLKTGFLEWLDECGVVMVNHMKLDQLKFMYNLSVFAFKYYEEIMEVIDAYPCKQKSVNEEGLAKLLEGINKEVVCM